ncbi:MAG: ROK family protein [Clostridia bacterium]|nr:ROK family protein [Clostridia bacterium]
MKIGIDIGGSHIGIGLVESNGNIIVKKEKNITSEDRKNIEKFIEETIAIAINEILRNNKIKAEDIEMIGIACPGTSKDGVIIKAENLTIYDFPIVEKLQRYFSAPIKLSNDGKCAGLCEKKYGALREYEDAVFICLGTGIGGAVFMNGKMLRPKRYLGMELGHITIKKDGLECSCGRKRMF